MIVEYQRRRVGTGAQVIRFDVRGSVPLTAEVYRTDAIYVLDALTSPRAGELLRDAALRGSWHIADLCWAAAASMELAEAVGGAALSRTRPRFRGSLHCRNDAPDLPAS